MAYSGFAFVQRTLSQALAGKRVFAIVLAVAGLLSACQDTAYLENGIGAQLPATDIAQSTALQDQYFQHLCRQAGYTTCTTLPTIDQPMWTLIVRQGMNDIDRRCDAYLQWLDDKKRSKGPLISQSNSVSAATQAIIQIVSPGSAAISIVGVAFGLLNQSIENYHSRLLLEIESSTINSVVLRARHDFRVAVQGKAFSNRPDAEYALREYLKRCLPFAIETQINDLSTLGSRGIAASEDNTIFQTPALGEQLREDTPRTVYVPVKPSRISGPTGADTMAESAIEKSYSEERVKGLQSRLCVPQSGKFDDATRTAIGISEVETGSGKANRVIDTAKEEEIIAFEPEGCSSLPTGAANTFEKFHFRTDERESAAMKIKRFQVGLLNCVNLVEQANARPFSGKPSAQELTTGTLGAPTRNAIKYLAVDLVAENAAGAASDGLLSVSVERAARNCVFTPKSN